MNTDAPVEVEQGDKLLVPAGGEASPLEAEQGVKMERIGDRV